ncbi:Alkaline phosphatase, tissue-nonspecific isozyme [Stylophora pistillata]|uniref:alkaline phosphatase n=1 Tax=Stylophora pistillata TaxID=50429 RepID=A0A2B4SRT5_STYPI|nr:Alkaline phosphatase, tissue-nonspecific isozyme [Stylophora pistillata]
MDEHPNSHYVWNQTGFDKIDTKKADHLVGLLEYSHMRFEIDRARDAAGEPSIADMIAKAIKILEKTPKGYFLLVEDETLITVTADHSHVFRIGAYPKLGNPIFGIVRWADGEAAVGPDNKTYTTLGYANGKGAVTGSRQDLRGVNTTHKNYRQQAAVLLPSETHGTEDVDITRDPSRGTHTAVQIRHETGRPRVRPRIPLRTKYDV